MVCFPISLPICKRNVLSSTSFTVAYSLVGPENGVVNSKSCHNTVPLDFVSEFLGILMCLALVKALAWNCMCWNFSVLRSGNVQEGHNISWGTHHSTAIYLNKSFYRHILYNSQLLFWNMGQNWMYNCFIFHLLSSEYSWHIDVFHSVHFHCFLKNRRKGLHFFSTNILGWGNQQGTLLLVAFYEFVKTVLSKQWE